MIQQTEYPKIRIGYESMESDFLISIITFGYEIWK